jgi:hypothetical protein
LGVLVFISKKSLLFNKNGDVGGWRAETRNKSELLLTNNY